MVSKIVEQRLPYEQYYNIDTPCDMGDWCYNIEKRNGHNVYSCSKRDALICPKLQSEGLFLQNSNWNTIPSNGSILPLDQNPGIKCDYQNEGPDTNEAVAIGARMENDKFRKKLGWILLILTLVIGIALGILMWHKMSDNYYE